MHCHLHSERWKELTPQFVASELLREVIGRLEPCGDDNAAGARRYAERALMSLHPVTRDPEACKEHDARCKGTFTMPGSAPAAPPATAVIDAQARLIAELEAKIKALEPKPPTEG